MKRIFLLSMVVLSGLLGPVQVAEAGRVGGPWGDHGWLHAGHTMVYDDVTFRGGQKASVAISGNGGMRLEIYDAQGNLVASSYTHAGPQGSECEVSWKPARTASFTIKIVNLQNYDPYCDNDIQFGVASN